MAGEAAEQAALLDRIELRRFVGRELLLWLWFESEVLDATLETKEHGSFGLWLGGRLVLTDGRESTAIKGVSPGAHREAKEALLRGKTADRVGFHLSIGDGEHTLALRGDTLGITALSPPVERTPDAPPEGAPPPVPRKRKSKRDEEADAASFAEHEKLLERMQHARDVEKVIEALYRDFLAIRLGGEWDAHVLPAIESWVAGEDVDADAYRRVRERAVRSGARASAGRDRARTRT